MVASRRAKPNHFLILIGLHRPPLDTISPRFLRPQGFLHPLGWVGSAMSLQSRNVARDIPACSHPTLKTRGPLPHRAFTAPWAQKR